MTFPCNAPPPLTSFNLMYCFWSFLRFFSSKGAKFKTIHINCCHSQLIRAYMTSCAGSPPINLRVPASACARPLRTGVDRVGHFVSLNFLRKHFDDEYWLEFFHRWLQNVVRRWSIAPGFTRHKNLLDLQYSDTILKLLYLDELKSSRFRFDISTQTTEWLREFHRYFYLWYRWKWFLDNRVMSLWCNRCDFTPWLSENCCFQQPERSII